MNSYLIIIVIALVVGLIFYTFAKDKGKNPIKAFIGGFIVSILAALGVLFIKKARDEKKK